MAGIRAVLTDILGTIDTTMTAELNGSPADIYYQAGAFQINAFPDYFADG